MGRLPALAADQSARIAALRSRYHARFEHRLSAATTLNNYEYLDVLDRAWTASGLPHLAGGVVCDVGCASFWYAAAIQAFFKPQELVGIEVEGYRLFKDGHSRIDYARGYLLPIAHARFVVADYGELELPADLIMAWFPFVTPSAILAWRLPLSLLSPERLFQRVYHNLKAGGRFMMVNHGPAEAIVAERLCGAAGLTCEFRFAESGVFSRHRLNPAVLSIWSVAAANPI